MTEAVMTNRASQWLLSKMEENKMSLRDAASAVKRATGEEIAHTTIADAVNGRKTSWDTWRLLAKTFKMPDWRILEWAGYLDPLPSKDEHIEAVEAYMREMSPAARKLSVRVIEALAKK